MDDSISRQAAIELFERELSARYNKRELAIGFIGAKNILENVPSARPTLYGYDIEHLAYIARVMEKEGVTAEYAVRTFDDISRTVRMIIEEAQRKVEEMLNE